MPIAKNQEEKSLQRQLRLAEQGMLSELQGHPEPSQQGKQIWRLSTEE